MTVPTDLQQEMLDRARERENIRDRITSIRRSVTMFEKNVKDQPDIPADALKVIVAMVQQVSDSALDLKLWTDPADGVESTRTRMMKEREEKIAKRV